MRRAISVAIALLSICRPAAGVEQRAILQLRLNEIEKGEVICLLRPNDLLVRSTDLEKAGLRSFLGQRETVEGETYVSLNSLAPNVAFRFDERALALHLTTQPSLLGSTLVDLRPGRPAGIAYSSDSSAFLNYAVNLRNFQRLDAFGEIGLSVKNGLLYSNLARDTDGQVTRGLTNWTLDDSERLMRWVIGDNLASSGNLGGTVSLGGISFAREFNLDPYFIRQPGLGLSGTILTPSTVDIYVNGLLVRREQLPPGQFELRNLPVQAGSGATRLVIRDAFGREREVTSPFYFTTGVLAPGLHEYGYNLGFRRNDLGSTSWDYGRLAFVGRHRVGLTDSLTAGLRLEGTRGFISSGPVLTRSFPFGEVEMAAAASHDEGHQGGAASLAYSYLGRTLSFGFLLRFLSAHYAHLSLGGAEDRPQVETSAAASMPIGSQSTLTLQYNRSQLRDGERDDRLSISASTRLTRGLHLFLSGSQSWKSSGGKFSTFAGLSYHFGNDVTASLSHQSSGSVHSGTVQLQKALPLGTGFGYRLESSSSESETGGTAMMQYQGPYGRYEGSYEHMNGQNVATLSAAGALVAIGGSLFPTRPVQESFALLRVPELEGVRGYLNNQEVGKTNARGDLLVPNLLPYYGNRLGVADQDIPLDRSIDATEKISAPPYRGGTMVVFPVRRTQRFAGSLLIEVSGETKIPAYGQLTVTAAGERFESPISKSGHFYLENVPAGRHRAAIEFGEKVCEFDLDIPKSNESTVELHDSRCVMPESKP